MLKFQRKTLCTLIAVSPKHCIMGTQAKRPGLKKLAYDFDRSCRLEKEKEIVLQVFGVCQALFFRQRRFLHKLSCVGIASSNRFFGNSEQFRLDGKMIFCDAITGVTWSNCVFAGMLSTCLLCIYISICQWISCILSLSFFGDDFTPTILYSCRLTNLIFSSYSSHFPFIAFSFSVGYEIKKKLFVEFFFSLLFKNSKIQNNH